MELFLNRQSLSSQVQVKICLRKPLICIITNWPLQSALLPTLQSGTNPEGHNVLFYRSFCWLALLYVLITKSFQTQRAKTSGKSTQLSALWHSACATQAETAPPRETHLKMGVLSTSWFWSLPIPPSYKSHSHLMIAVEAPRPWFMGALAGGHRRGWHFTKCYRAVLTHYTPPPTYELIWLKVEDQSNSIASERLITSALSDLIISVQPWG